MISLIDTKSGRSGTVRYRDEAGTYPEKERKRIFGLFRVPANSDEEISLRLIALLDRLQDHFGAAAVRIVSGFRSPEYNEGLRKKGRLAARTSLHIEGMAADIEIPGAEARAVWDYVRSLDCCGAGYYHGAGIHIDTGPNRFWDEKTTGVEKDLGSMNRLILLRTDRDIYLAGETIRLTLARITDYPFGLRPQTELVGTGKKIRVAPGEGCVPIRNRADGRSLSWTIPADFGKTEKMRIRLEFCDKPFPEMPDQIESNLFVLAE